MSLRSCYKSHTGDSLVPPKQKATDLMQHRTTKSGNFFLATIRKKIAKHLFFPLKQLDIINSYF